MVSRIIIKYDIENPNQPSPESVLEATVNVIETPEGFGRGVIGSRRDEEDRGESLTEPAGQREGAVAQRGEFVGRELCHD